jgi:hypothetical protein
MSLMERLGHADMDRLNLYLVSWCLVCSGTIWSEQNALDLWIEDLALTNRLQPCD